MLERFKAKQKSGFTLVEILVVVVIVAILAAVLIPKIAGFTDKAKESGVITDFRSMQTSVQGVGILNTGFKGFEDADALVAAINKDLDVRLGFEKAAAEDVTNHGVVLDDLISKQLDPWGKPYKMIVDTATNDAVIIVSAGVDGKFDTEVSNVSAPTDAIGAVTKATADDDLVLFVGQVEGTTVVKTAGLSKDIK